ncbi:hypothetical protein [Stieleria maiorica]|uniref:hypothetical protein n=1 Tax=Stieleria maiorica TaxID=2795974 RepID=UPI0011CBC9CE|nr:hypothetical protein [Stieleria maiorica]
MLTVGLRVFESAIEATPRVHQPFQQQLNVSQNLPPSHFSRVGEQGEELRSFHFRIVILEDRQFVNLF